MKKAEGFWVSQAKNIRCVREEDYEKLFTEHTKMLKRQQMIVLPDPYPSFVELIKKAPDASGTLEHLLECYEEHNDRFYPGDDCRGNLQPMYDGWKAALKLVSELNGDAVYGLPPFRYVAFAKIMGAEMAKHDCFGFEPVVLSVVEQILGAEPDPDPFNMEASLEELLFADGNELPECAKGVVIRCGCWECMTSRAMTALTNHRKAKKLEAT